MVAECGYDNGDCDGSESASVDFDTGCAPGCLPGWPGDGWCDQACMVEDCEMDRGDCDIVWCAEECPPSYPGDEYCDPGEWRR